MDLWIVFLTGLTVGGLTCLAVQGGLLASVIASRKSEAEGIVEKRLSVAWPVSAFMIGKVISHLLLGFLLGWFGAALALSDTARIIMQIIAGTYMVVIALNMLNVHPIFRYVIIQPPRFLTKAVRDESRSKDLFAPFILGVMTIFIPCGTTLAMITLAISTGNPLFGALIMLFFTLGTIPLFFGLGFITNFLGDVLRKRFYKIAAFLIIYIAITTINGSLVLAGSPITLQTLTANSPIQIDLSGGNDNKDANVRMENGVQVADIQIYPNSYTPNYIRVQKGIPVRLNLSIKGGIGCTSQFRIPTLKVSKDLPFNGSDIVEFTPTIPGKITWTCSMGMYSGIMEVI